MRMRLGRTAIVSAGAFCLAWLSAGVGTAIEPSPLPSFDLVGMDGETVGSGALAGVESWLLVSVRPTSSASRSLLKALAAQTQKDAGAAAGRVVVVVDGTADAAREMRQGYADLTASWYADPAHQAFQRLRLQGAPTVLGLRAGFIVWTLQGALSGKDLGPLTSWLGAQPHP